MSPIATFLLLANASAVLELLKTELVKGIQRAVRKKAKG